MLDRHPGAGTDGANDAKTQQLMLQELMENTKSMKNNNGRSSPQSSITTLGQRNHPAIRGPASLMHASQKTNNSV